MFPSCILQSNFVHDSPDKIGHKTWLKFHETFWSFYLSKWTSIIELSAKPWWNLKQTLEPVLIDNISDRLICFTSGWFFRLANILRKYLLIKNYRIGLLQQFFVHRGIHSNFYPSFRWWYPTKFQSTFPFGLYLRTCSTILGKDSRHNIEISHIVKAIKH